MRFTPTTARHRRNFERFTLAHMAMTRAPTQLESGHSFDTRSNAGAQVLDYGSLFSMRQGLGYTITEDNMHRTRPQRELSFLLCDGRQMGPRLTEAYPGGEQQQYGDIEWGDCDYAIINDLRWTAQFAAPRFDEIPIYQQVIIEADDQVAESMGTQIYYPLLNGDYYLQDFLDDAVVAGIEAEFGDVWHSSGEAIEVPYAATLMRSPLIAPQELEADVTLLDDSAQRHRLAHAPIGLLRAEETEDIEQWWTDQGQFQHLWMTPFTGGNVDPSERDYNDPRVYRAWEPYDAVNNILDRQWKTVHPWLSGGSPANQVWQFDDELLNGYEPVGTGFYGRAAMAPMTFTLSGSFTGDIRVSKSRPDPLILHFASLPIRLGGYTTPVTGTRVQIFARPYLIPIHWNVTCNLKTG